MKIDFKKVFLLGLVASLPCLAQEDYDNSKEVTMSSPREKCAPEECRGLEGLGLTNCKPRVEECDHDVYTAGNGEERESRRNYERRCCEKQRKKNGCDNQCKRKGAAKVAQE